MQTLFEPGLPAELAARRRSDTEALLDARIVAMPSLVRSQMLAETSCDVLVARP